MAFIGEEVLVHDDSIDEYIEGKMLGVDENGFLKIWRKDTQKEVTIINGTLRKLPVKEV